MRHIARNIWYYSFPWSVDTRAITHACNMVIPWMLTRVWPWECAGEESIFSLTCPVCNLLKHLEGSSDGGGGGGSTWLFLYLFDTWPSFRAVKAESRSCWVLTQISVAYVNMTHATAKGMCGDAETGMHEPTHLIPRHTLFNPGLMHSSKHMD